MSKSHEPAEPESTKGRGPQQIQVHVNPMYIVVTQLPPGQTISVQVNINNSDGGHSTVSIPNIQVGTTVINTNARAEAMATELIILATRTDP